VRCTQGVNTTAYRAWLEDRLVDALRKKTVLIITRTRQAASPSVLGMLRCTSHELMPLRYAAHVVYFYPEKIFLAHRRVDLWTWSSFGLMWNPNSTLICYKRINTSWNDETNNTNINHCQKSNIHTYLLRSDVSYVGSVVVRSVWLAVPVVWFSRTNVHHDIQ